MSRRKHTDFPVFKRLPVRGAWAAPLVKHLSLDFGLDHDLMVREIKPYVWLCTESMEPAWDSLSLSVPLSCMYVLSLSNN